MLNSVSVGEGDVPLIIVHGLFGSARNWRSLQKRLGQNRWVIAVDLRNHGESFWDDDNSYPALAADIAEVIDANGGVADVLGHSMGGKAAMVLALSQPEKIRNLIVADMAPTAYQRTQVQHVEAMKSVDLSVVARRTDADMQLAKRLDTAALRAFFVQSIEISDKGARWQLNLDALGAEMPKIMGFPAVQGMFENRTLMLTGAESDYVTPEIVPEILRLFPQAEFERIAGAGHWLHAENPREFLAAVERFLG